MEKIALGVNSNIQTVIVGGVFDVGGGNQQYSFNARIDVNFEPDLIVLKHYDLTIDNATTPSIYKVSSNLVNSDILSFPFIEQKYFNGINDAEQDQMLSVECERHFLNKAKKMINGLYSFQLSDYAGNIPNIIFAELTMVFEFIKF